MRGFLTFKLFICLFLAALSLHCCVQIFSSYEEQGLLSGSSGQASHCSGFSCYGAQAVGPQASVVVTAMLLISDSLRNKVHGIISN